MFCNYNLLIAYCFNTGIFATTNLRKVYIICIKVIWMCKVYDHLQKWRLVLWLDKILKFILKFPNFIDCINQAYFWTMSSATGWSNTSIWFRKCCPVLEAKKLCQTSSFTLTRPLYYVLRIYDEINMLHCNAVLK